MHLCVFPLPRFRPLQFAIRNLLTRSLSFLPPFHLSLRLILILITVLTLITKYLTHHYLIDLVAGGSLACAYFYYYLARMPDELRHPTIVAAAYSNSIPLDPEAGGGSKLNGNGYGGWDGEDEDDGFEMPESRR